MDIDVDKICQDLMNDIANALTQYNYLAIFINAQSEMNDKQMSYLHSEVETFIFNYLKEKKHLTKYADLIGLIQIGISLINKSSFLLDSRISKANKEASYEVKNLVLWHRDAPEVSSLFKDCGASLKALILNIHDQYFELIVARVNQIKENKK